MHVSSSTLFTLIYPLALFLVQYDELRRAVVRVGKESATTAANATSREEAEEALETGLAAVEQVCNLSIERERER